jgi:hypothetical protein
VWEEIVNFMGNSIDSDTGGLVWGMLLINHYLNCIEDVSVRFEAHKDLLGVGFMALIMVS